MCPQPQVPSQASMRIPVITARGQVEEGQAVLVIPGYLEFEISSAPKNADKEIEV